MSPSAWACRSNAGDRDQQQRHPRPHLRDRPLRVRGVLPTISPSMDIQVSSNFERLLFDSPPRRRRREAADGRPRLNPVASRSRPRASPASAPTSLRAAPARPRLRHDHHRSVQPTPAISSTRTVPSPWPSHATFSAPRRSSRSLLPIRRNSPPPSRRRRVLNRLCRHGCLIFTTDEERFDRSVNDQATIEADIPARIPGGEEHERLSGVRRLDNGMTVFTDDMPHLESASLGILGQGRLPQRDPGLAWYLARARAYGLQGHQARAVRSLIAEAIEIVGGDLNAVTSGRAYGLLRARIEGGRAARGRHSVVDILR